MQPPAAAVLGIAPHSGWAAAVLLAGTPAAPRVILRERHCASRESRSAS